MDIENLLQKYHNVSREESEKIRETTNFYGLREIVYESAVRILHDNRESEKVMGKESVVAGPLVHVISVEFLPYKIDREEPISAYGRIYSECCDTSTSKIIVHDLYNRMFDDAEVLGPSGSLTLTSSSVSSWPCMPLHSTRLVVDVYVRGKTSRGAGYFSCSGSISCVEDINNLEHVKVAYLHNELGVFSMRYIAMPFGIYADMKVQFFHKFGGALDEKNPPFLNVNGKIVARYGNTYGGYDSEKCTLFEKQPNEFQRVGFDLGARSMRLARSWVGLPVYSSLVVDIDLAEFESGCKILKEILKFQVEGQRASYAEFIVGDFLIRVAVAWVSPGPQGRCSAIEDESSNDEMSLQGSSKDDSNDEQMDETCVPEASSSLTRPWQLGVHRSVPLPSALVEIFSIFIGREKFKSLQVYGSVEVSSLLSTFYFNNEATYAFGLLEGSKTIPVLDGSFTYDDCEPLKMKVDLKDVGSSFHIKGYVDWDSRTLDYGAQWLNKQLCSVVEGDHGFAAIHYSIFPEAVQANIGVLCTKNNGMGMLPKVYGSIFARYNDFDYTSAYNKDYYRVVLFERNQQDSAPTSDNGAISLSRSMVAVPLKSSLLIDVNLWVGDDQVLLQSTREFLIGVNDMTLENNDYSLHIYVKWG